MTTTDTITLPALWASALINDDWSGLEGDGSGLAGNVADYTVLT